MPIFQKGLGDKIQNFAFFKINLSSRNQKYVTSCPRTHRILVLEGTLKSSSLPLLTSRVEKLSSLLVESQDHVFCLPVQVAEWGEQTWIQNLSSTSAVFGHSGTCSTLQGRLCAQRNSTTCFLREVPCSPEDFMSSLC